MTEHGCMLEEEVRGTAECEGEDEAPFLELEKTIIKEFDLDVGRKPWIFYKEDGKDRQEPVIVSFKDIFTLFRNEGIEPDDNHEELYHFTRTTVVLGANYSIETAKGFFVRDLSIVE